MDGWEFIGKGRMMFSQNVKSELIDGVMIIKIHAFELQELFKKYDGMIHVEIKRPQQAKTDAQNRAFHSLLTEYFLSGYHSAPDGINHDLDRFKVWIKARYGVTYTLDVDGEKKLIIESWSKYTKEQAGDCITRTISDIETAGALSGDGPHCAKIREIIKTMEDNSLIRLGGKA